MSRNYYSEINLHITWHTKNNQPMLSSNVESFVQEELRRRIVETPGAFVHEIGGTDDHVHVAVTVPPTLTPSQWIGELKGGVSYDVNRRIGHRNTDLQWQSGYGVVSFGTADLEWLRAYIRNQQTHHASGTVHERLERSTQLED